MRNGSGGEKGIVKRKNYALNLKMFSGGAALSWHLWRK